MTEIVNEGGCLCGAIRYLVRGRPRYTVMCHSDSCRRASGSPVMAWASFPRDRFELLRGHPMEFRSSPPVTRTFCATCGTSLTASRAERPGDVGITICSLDHPDVFPPDHHSFTCDRIGWLRLDDGLPAFRRYPGAPEER
jgi:hypothetical protein